MVAAGGLVGADVSPALGYEYAITSPGLPSGDYESSSGSRINNGGQVAVYCSAAGSGLSRNSRSYLWENGVWTDVFPSASKVVITELGNSGEVGGTYNVNGTGPWRGGGFVYQDGAARVVAEPTDTSYDRVLGLNDRGDVVWARGNTPMLTDASGATVALNINGVATRITNDGTILSVTSGPAEEGGRTYAILYLPGGSTEQVELAGNYVDAYGINEQHDVVGAVSAGPQTLAFWYHDGTFDVLPLLTTDGQAWAEGINAHGLIVGVAMDAAGANAAGTIWRDGRPVDVNTLIDPALGWTVTRLLDVNDSGVIVGEGYINGEERAVILTPVPEGGTAVFGVGAILWLAGARRRGAHHLPGVTRVTA